MKLASILTAALIAIAAPAVHAHATHGQPQYGGIYGEAGTFQAELVVKDAQVTIYITLHGEPVSAKGASGKLTILGADGKQEVELKPASDNKLLAHLKSPLAKGSKVVANITLEGKGPANVRYSIE
jgi:hypothetical protein